MAVLIKVKASNRRRTKGKEVMWNEVLMNVKANEGNKWRDGKEEER